MRVSKEFQPITIVIETKEEAAILEDALNLLVKDCMRRGGSRWFGFKDQKLSATEMRYRTMVKQILGSINPDYKQSSLFVHDWS